jgi:hypothetical protein
MAEGPFGFHVARPPMRKTKWSLEEDEQLRLAVRSVGITSWSRVSKLIPFRTGKQCRERWVSQLAPGVSKNRWLPEEDAVVLRSHAAMGNYWTAIARNLSGRSPISVKNRWNWLQRHGSASEAPENALDVVENPPPKPCQVVFEPLVFESGLFGPGFQEFQAKMLVRQTPKHSVNS